MLLAIVVTARTHPRHVTLWLQHQQWHKKGCFIVKSRICHACHVFYTNDLSIPTGWQEYLWMTYVVVNRSKPVWARGSGLEAVALGMVVKSLSLIHKTVGMALDLPKQHPKLWCPEKWCPLRQRRAELSGSSDHPTASVWWSRGDSHLALTESLQECVIEIGTSQSN